MSEFIESPWSSDGDMAAGRGKWAFWERFDAPDYDDPSKTYLSRLRIISTPWFGIYLHRFYGPDPRWTLHDHPWPFVSFVLRGGYVERRPGGFRRVRWVNVLRRGDVHAIVSLNRTPTTTLMLVGRRNRKWGYVEPTGDGYTWTAFDKHPHSEEFSKALKARKGLTSG